MPIPEYPITRKEQYLDRIAGGNHPLPPRPVTREEQYLDEIAQHGGGGLPEVTEEDNGKFLRVVDGEWAAVDIPDAGGVSF